MSPRSGGEAAKFGERYEGRWTARHLLYVLLGDVDSVTVEDVGEISLGAEFTVRRGTKTEIHQVKRQIGDANEWELHVLKNNGVLAAAQHHVSRGRQFWFVSTIPAAVLNSLADAARRSPDLQSFVEHMLTSQRLRTGFDYLSGKAYGSAETAWRTLHGLEVLWPDERDLTHMNAVLAGLLLEGAAPELAAVGLGNLVKDHLRTPLGIGKLTELLEPFGLRPKQLLGNPTIRQSVSTILTSWKESVERELLQPAIPRAEARDLADQLQDSRGLPLFVIGSGGGGKSAVLYQAVDRIQADGWPVLALRLDRIEPFSSTTELGQRRNLDVSPVTALAAVAQGGPSALVIDQLDALSLASGRMPTTFDVIIELLREARAFPEMRVILACREFDANNDHRIRALAATEGVGRIQVTGLSDEQVDQAVRSMGLGADRLSDKQRDLLRTPLHLVLLQTVADQPDALSFTTSRQLFDAYWDRKEQDSQQQRPANPPRFAPVIGALAEVMSERQRLVVPESVLDADDLHSDAKVLISQGVLVLDGRRLAFFHEAFFDYAFARRWINRGQSLVEFLHAGEQELFRRGQIRQILVHLRDEEPERYVSEVEAVLSDPAVRFHIKDTALAFLQALTDPAAAEWQMMARLVARALPFADRLWVTMRTVPWFERLDAEGVIAGWLASHNPADHAHAIEVMLGAATKRADRMAELLAPYAGHAADYPAWLSWITRFGNLYKSRALFELVLAAIRRGDYQDIEHTLWVAAHGLGQRRPAWAAELLAVYLADRPHALDLDDLGNVVALRSTEHVALELASQSADGAPEQFCKLLLPYMLQVMQLTERSSQTLPIVDQHFSRRYPINGPPHELDDALLRGAVTALHKLVAANAEAARPILEILAADPHDSAQWLLYEGLREAGADYADWAAALLLEGDHRLISGYAENPAWTTRLLLQAITPHLSAESSVALEGAVMDLRPSWQRTVGWASFTLLSGMDEERLSTTARRHLGELRRRFNMEQPPAPVGVQRFFVGPPIPPEAAGHMSDEQWLGAINQYNTDTTDFETLRGGAHELSEVLKTQATADPVRFAHLALRLTRQAHPAYSDAILIALADTQQPIDPAPVFDAIRHIASLGLDEYQDWLGWPLRRYLDDEIPDDIIEIVLDRALHATSPAEDGWAGHDGGRSTYGGDIFNDGFGSARGQSAIILGDLVIHDVTGHRTALVAPSLPRLATDASVAVRSCVAHLLAACLRHARGEAVGAFQHLISTDDRLLTTRQVLDLMAYIGWGEPEVIEPVIERMIGSTYAEVREAGGWMAAFAGLDLGLGHLLATARAGQDAHTRKGAARLCAHRLPHTSDATAAVAALEQFFSDEDTEVRKAAAEIAGVLRGQALQPYTAMLTKLIASSAFSDALAHLLITLEQAPDRIDDLFIRVSVLNRGAADPAPTLGLS